MGDGVGLGWGTTVGSALEGCFGRSRPTSGAHGGANWHDSQVVKHGAPRVCVVCGEVWRLRCKRTFGPAKNGAPCKHKKRTVHVSKPQTCGYRGVIQTNMAASVWWRVALRKPA